MQRHTALRAVAALAAGRPRAHTEIATAAALVCGGALPAAVGTELGELGR